MAKKIYSALLQIQEEIHPDKTAIYQALKAGQKVPGTKLVPNRKTIIK